MIWQARLCIRDITPMWHCPWMLRWLTDISYTSKRNQNLSIIFKICFFFIIAFHMDYKELVELIYYQKQTTVPLCPVEVFVPLK